MLTQDQPIKISGKQQLDNAGNLLQMCFDCVGDNEACVHPLSDVLEMSSHLVYVGYHQWRLFITTLRGCYCLRRSCGSSADPRVPCDSPMKLVGKPLLRLV